MRLLIFSVLLAVLGSCNMNSAQKESKALKNFEAVQTITGVKAQVKENAGVYMLQLMNNGREVNYVPLNLSEDLKVANTWVEVSGEVGQLAADIKSMGFPMKISEISVVEEITEKAADKVVEQTETKTDESSQMNKEQGTKRTLEAKEAIDFRGSKLTVNRAVTHELGILVSRGGDGKNWLIEQYKNGQVYNRLIPINLAKEFMTNGMQIEFDGHIGNPPANVRLMGSPIHIEYMAKYEGEDLKTKKKSTSGFDTGDSKFK